MKKLKYNEKKTEKNTEDTKAMITKIQLNKDLKKKAETYKK